MDEVTEEKYWLDADGASAAASSKETCVADPRAWHLFGSAGQGVWRALERMIWTSVVTVP